MMPARRIALAVLVLTVALALTPAARAYLKFGTAVGNTVVALKWDEFPVRYSITNRSIAGVTAAQVQGAVANAFARSSRGQKEPCICSPTKASCSS